MASLLVGVTATDPATDLTIALLFVLIADLACRVPARRAARLNPLAALRQTKRVAAQAVTTLIAISLPQ